MQGHARFEEAITYKVFNFSEPNFDPALVQVGVVSRVVDKFAQFALAHFRRPIAENEQQRIDGVGFPRSIRSHNRGERLEKMIQC